MTMYPPSDSDLTLADAVGAIRELDLSVHSFGSTDCGKVRKTNEDQFVVARISRAIQLEYSSVPQAQTLFGERHGHLFMVADGMGGHSAGEQASALAVVAIEEFLLNTLKWFFRLSGESILSEFQEALRTADTRVFEESARHPEFKGMGTTVTMGYSTHDALYVVHVGDSRAYLFRDGVLRQLTRDHTLVEEMVRGGMLTPEEAAHNPLRSVITNAVGGAEPGIKVEVHKVSLMPGDVVLFCSDGLTGMVKDEQIAAVLAGEQNPQIVCENLLAQANELGGLDNITAIVARFTTVALSAHAIRPQAAKGSSS